MLIMQLLYPSIYLLLELQVEFLQQYAGQLPGGFFITNIFCLQYGKDRNMHGYVTY